MGTSLWCGWNVKYFLIILTSLAVLWGCSPVGTQMRAWKGAPLNELIIRVGAPSSVSADMGGYRLYHWYEDRGAVYTYGGMVNLSCDRTIGVDDDDFIISVDWRGNCIAPVDSPWARSNDTQSTGVSQ
ncbi:lipoprotein [Geobacter sulfurreducens subsp. ethanolicus]|nr:lipoprotein [Geobacter sulfurreducens subsp. ethanolicus]